MVWDFKAGMSRFSRIRHTPRRRAVTVDSVQPVGTRLISVTFRGEDLTDFASEGFDDHIKLFITTADGQEISREMTPRNPCKGSDRLSIEFALHDGGAACEWAQSAVPGTPAVIAGPKNSLVVSKDLDWYVLAGDCSAFPAIQRRLEELPETARVIVVAQANDNAPPHPFAASCTPAIHWLPKDADMANFLRELDLPSGDGFLWCAGEAGIMEKVRYALREERRLAPEMMKIAAYWRADVAGFHATLEPGMPKESA